MRTSDLPIFYNRNFCPRASSRAPCESSQVCVCVFVCVRGCVCVCVCVPRGAPKYTVIPTCTVIQKDPAHPSTRTTNCFPFFHFLFKTKTQSLRLPAYPSRHWEHPLLHAPQRPAPPHIWAAPPRVAARASAAARGVVGVGMEEEFIRGMEKRRRRGPGRWVWRCAQRINILYLSINTCMYHTCIHIAS